MGGLRVQAVIGSSAILRDEAQATVRASWSGPVHVVTEPEDLEGVLYGLDAPPLFGDPALVILRADEKWLKSRQDAIAAHVPREIVAGTLLVVAPALDQRWGLAKALVKAKALREAGPPDAKSLPGWLTARIGAHPQGVQDPRALSALLIERVGQDVDALLQAMDVVALHAGEGAVGVADAEAVLLGVGQRPIWDLTGAILTGDAARALELLHAGEVEPEGVLAALLSELRRLVACSESPDDAQVAVWIGSRGNLYYARRRAQEVGRKNLLRLFNGAIQLQRRFRSGGIDPTRELESFVLHARRLLKGPQRANPIGPARSSSTLTNRR